MSQLHVHRLMTLERLLHAGVWWSLGCITTLFSAFAIAEDESPEPTISVGGRYDAVLLRSDGSVWACAGADTADYSKIPAGGDGYPAQQLPPGSARHISGGRFAAFADALAVGVNFVGELGAVYPFFSSNYLPAPPIAGHPVEGRSVTFYKVNGQLMAGGNNEDGELGNGTADNDPHPVFAPVLVPNGSPLSPVRSVAMGSKIEVALVGEGRVFAWGLGVPGIVGNQDYAIPVAGLPHEDITAIAAADTSNANFLSGDHVLVLTEHGTVWGWGENRDGELGNGKSGTRSDGTTAPMWQDTPVQVLVGPDAPLTHVVAIAAGGAHSLAVREDGTVWSWGYDGSGQLGRGSVHEGANAYAAKIPSLSHIASVAAGSAQSFAIDDRGRAWSWGWNARSTLCIGPAAPSGNPRDPLNQIAAPTRIVDATNQPFDLVAGRPSDD